MNLSLSDIQADIEFNVKHALLEDIGTGDITAQLVPGHKTTDAKIITRENCILCGQAWLEETFRQLGGLDKIDWHFKDGDKLSSGSTIVSLRGSAKTLLTGERTALNFIQLLSAVATKTHEYASILTPGSELKILDTRKTIPGLRRAQKYAVTVGGCHNHRIGLFDAFLIKENHIAACGGIAAAISTARKIAPEKPVEVETETIEQLKEAIDAGADIAMLDNFSDEMLRQAIELDRHDTKFEVSGNLSIERLKEISALSIDFCSFGNLTKHIQAIDLSMRIND